MAIGFPCIAAADSFADETISKMLSDKYFGVVQYIATSIVGKGLFALMADNINSNGNLIFYLGWVFAIIGISIHLYIVMVSENKVAKSNVIRTSLASSHMPSLLHRSFLNHVNLSSLTYLYHPEVYCTFDDG